MAVVGVTLVVVGTVEENVVVLKATVVVAASCVSDATSMQKGLKDLSAITHKSMALAPRTLPARTVRAVLRAPLKAQDSS